MVKDNQSVSKMSNKMTVLIKLLSFKQTFKVMLNITIITIIIILYCTRTDFVYHIWLLYYYLLSSMVKDCLYIKYQNKMLQFS